MATLPEIISTYDSNGDFTRLSRHLNGTLIDKFVFTCINSGNRLSGVQHNSNNALATPGKGGTCVLLILKTTLEGSHVNNPRLGSGDKKVVANKTTLKGSNNNSQV